MGMDDETLMGSSPLARGLPKGFLMRIVRNWIIPARAGFTFTSPPIMRLQSDHPRSRGVYPNVIFKDSLKKGSSPLARGLR